MIHSSVHTSTPFIYSSILPFIHSSIHSPPIHSSIQPDSQLSTHHSFLLSSIIHLSSSYPLFHSSSILCIIYSSIYLYNYHLSTIFLSMFHPFIGLPSIHCQWQRHHLANQYAWDTVVLRCKWPLMKYVHAYDQAKWGFVTSASSRE